MHKLKFRNIIAVIMLMTACHAVLADDNAISGIEAKKQWVVRKDSATPKVELPEDMVVVDGDTISMIIPERNYGRYDRGLYNYLYIPKGSLAMGLTASLGSLNTDDVKVLSTFDNVNFHGKIFSINPSVSYFIKHNQSVGLRMTYTHGVADLGSLSLDIDDEINFNLHDISYHKSNCKVGLFYRNYIGLNRGKRFAVFNEVALDGGLGTTYFKRYYGDVLYNTRTRVKELSLNFSPGLCIFIQDYVAFNVSFGVFGLNVQKENQDTNGIDEGSRISSGANFRFNIFNINFGLLVVI